MNDISYHQKIIRHNNLIMEEDSLLTEEKNFILPKVIIDEYFWSYNILFTFSGNTFISFIKT